jgi:hypothetical protein
MRRTGLPLLLILLTACTVPGAEPAAKAPAAAANPPIGAVTPPPAGCISLTFLGPEDEKMFERNARGRLTEVISPKGRKEPILARIDWNELEELVPRIAEIAATQDVEALSHIPSYYAHGHVPGPPAWEYLQRFLGPTDIAWTFGEVDTGLLIVRDEKPFCILYIAHPVPEE